MVIHKSVSPFGDWIIFMNGRMLYKKWPGGRSVIFDKYGPPISNNDRDHSSTAQAPSTETSQVTENPYSKRSPETETAMVRSLLEDVCANESLVGRATCLFRIAADGLYWKSDEQLAEFNLAELRDHFNLKTLIDLIDPGQYPTMPVEVRIPIRLYLESLPGFRPEMGYEQPQETFDWHGQSEMDLTKLLGSLHDTYSYLFPREIPEPLRIADSVYRQEGGFSPDWLNYLLAHPSSSEEATETATVRVPLDGVEGLPEDIIEIASELGAGPIADALHAERQRWQAEIERLRNAADYIAPYLRWTVGEESPGHHPTMPSAVAAFHVAFDIDTPEKRMARMRRKNADMVADAKSSA
jgi:hypothetical protein